jgi:DNA-directed RNA polymerase subunit RPC12/RpoP
MGKYTCMDCKETFHRESSVRDLPKCPRCRSIHVLKAQDEAEGRENRGIPSREGGQPQAKSEEEIQEAIKRAWAEIAWQRRDREKEKTIHWVDNQMDADILRLPERSTRSRNEIRATSIFRSKHASKAAKLMLVMALLPLGLMLAAWAFLTLFTPP